MTIDEFKEKVDGAPFSLDEVAQILTEVDADGESWKVGRAYLDAQEDLFNLLEELEIELG